MSFFRFIFSALDLVIYTLTQSIYELLMKISNVEIFSGGTLKAFSERIYALLGIFMAFKLIFTFINYVVNPDSMTEAKTGGKQLVISIMVSLVLLIAVPSIIFPLSRQLQQAILSEGVLQEVILGIDANTYKDSINTRNASRNLSYSVLSGFIYPRPEVCKPSETDFYEDENAPTSFEEMDKDKDGKQNYRFKLDGNCAEDINEAMSSDAEATVLAYERAYNQKSVKNLLGDSVRTAKTNDGEYVFEYMFLISTIVGGFVAWILFGFCFHIAVRTIKLGFLELIAPIPILSYIDPKTRQKSFDGWLKSVIGTYVDLFIRLGAINFAVFIISLISRPGALKYAFVPEGSDGSVGFLVLVFIIIGALMFAEQVPKLIEEITGLKLDGKFSLNPLKNSKLASSVVGGAVGLAGGAALGGVGNFLANRAKNEDARKKYYDDNADKFRQDGVLDEVALNRSFKSSKDYMGVGSQLGSVVGGIGGGSFRSGMSGMKSKNGIKGIGTGLSASSNARRSRQGGYGSKQKFMDKATDLFGIETASGTTGILKDEIKKHEINKHNYEEQAQNLSASLSRMQSSKTSSFMDAFARDEDGDKMYQDYNEYITKTLDGTSGGQEFSEKMEAIMNSALDDADKDRLFSEQLNSALANGIISSDEIINKTEYSNYDRAEIERDKLHKLSVKEGKAIKQKTEIQEKAKGGKK